MKFYAWYDDAYCDGANIAKLLLGIKTVKDFEMDVIEADTLEEAFKNVTGNELQKDDPWRVGQLLAMDYSEGHEGYVILSEKALESKLRN